MPKSPSHLRSMKSRLARGDIMAPIKPSVARLRLLANVVTSPITAHIYFARAGRKAGEEINTSTATSAIETTL